MLQASDTMKHVLHNKTVITARRQAPNLKRLLTKADVCDNIDKPCVNKCGMNYETCKTIQERSSFIFSNGAKTFTVKEHFSFNSRNLLNIV